VQVDDVGHHRRAHDPDREVDPLLASEARHQAAQRPGGRRPDLQRLVEKAGEDDPEQGGDRELEGPKAAALELEDRERDRPGDETGREQGDAEDQVKADRRPEELGHIGRHRHHLGLHPQGPRRPAREQLAAQLGQAVAGGHAELGRQILNDHRHQVGQQDDPQKSVAEPGAGRDIGGEVARVHVDDRGYERRSEHGQRGA